ncbi:MAG TPA: GNAT family N-acetyltransferase [Planococcus sp. (in: firmicutes)]|nr:GNAT family N-acetyltransferase [Planococcus sp. (in: firmicutes)]
MDIYLEENYGRLYEPIEKGQCEVFRFENELGSIRHMFIKREIPIDIDGQRYYDLLTPYGYGGPMILNSTESHKTDLVKAFEKEFRKYCTGQNIVSEFVRFHPMLLNAPDFTSCYETVLRRNTTGTNLKDYEDPIVHEFSKSKQKSIKKALQAGVEYRITRNPACLEQFKELYYSTMKRKNADSVYFFDDTYFDNLLEYLGNHILIVEVIYDGQVIGMGLNFVYNKTIHIHLSGTIPEFHHFSSAFILRYALVRWGKENGMELIHEGGGKTGEPDDPLYLFKKQFGKNTEFEFYVGYKIWNPEVYSQLCIATRTDSYLDSFPAYRKEVKEESDLLVKSTGN